MDLEQAREAIRAADEEMAALFVRRMEAVREVAAYKRARGLPVEDPAQEARVIEGRSALVEDPELRSFYVRFLQHTMEVSKQWQHRLLEGLRVCYCGVEGAFAHIAARRIFPEGIPVSCPSFDAAYAAVEAGDADFAVLPIENSYAGEVGQVLDLMYSGPLHVNGVYDLSVTHNLLGVRGARAEEVRTVVSHPQALMQCEDYIRSHALSSRSAANTAVAAREVAEAGDRHTAAIASEETAALYGLDLLDRAINDSRENTTRFAVFSRIAYIPAGRRDGAFLLLFTLKDEPGSLAGALSVISAYGFNLRVLRSRPLKSQPWHYFFYAEAVGDDCSENGKRMAAALRGLCPSVRIVGHYTASGNALQGGERI